MELIFGLLIFYVLYRVGKKAISSNSKPVRHVDEHTVRIGSNSSYSSHQFGNDEVVPPRWVSLDRQVTIKNYTIAGGVYVANAAVLYSPRWGERHYLNSTLAVAASTGHDRLPYWPSYQEISPNQRGGYLYWLASGKRAKNAPLGYIFLYFYGLEHRRFQTPSISDQECQELREEVIRLVTHYGHNESVRSYLTKYLIFDQIARATGGRLYQSLPKLNRTHNIDLIGQIALSQSAADGVPLPAQWALKIAFSYPEIRRATPMSRCASKLQELFAIRYREVYGEGIQFKQNKRTIRLRYASASHDFECAVEPAEPIHTVGRLHAHSKKLAALVEACAQELAKYSRLLGDGSVNPDSRIALASLPPELATAAIGISDDPFRRYIELLGVASEQEPCLVNSTDMIDRWDVNATQRTTSGALRKQANIALVNYLGLIGLGMVPDVRRGGRKLKPGEIVFLYPAPNTTEVVSAAYRRADNVLKLLAIVAKGDGRVGRQEIESMQRYLGGLDDLTQEERLRLQVSVRYYSCQPPALRKSMGEVPSTVEQRRKTATAALRVAMADGLMDKGELATLQKIYRLLGLDVEDIYNDVNAIMDLQSPSTLAIDEPVLIRQASKTKREAGFTLPQEDTEDTTAVPQPTDLQLDMAAIAAKRKETAAASALLASIFQDDEVEEEETESGSKKGEEKNLTFEGLDATHAALLETLLTDYPQCSEDTFRELAEARGLMAGGALESINEWGFDQFDDFILEEGDLLEINTDLLPQLKNAIA